MASFIGGNDGIFSNNLWILGNPCARANLADFGQILLYISFVSSHLLLSFFRYLCIDVRREGVGSSKICLNFSLSWNKMNLSGLSFLLFILRWLAGKGFKYCLISLKVWSLYWALRHKFSICFLKFKALSIVIPSNSTSIYLKRLI